MFLRQVQALLLTLLLLAGGPLSGRACPDCRPVGEPAPALTDAHHHACCSAEPEAPTEAPDDRTNDGSGCDCPLGCCAPVFAKAITPGGPGLIAPAPDHVWDVLPDPARRNPGTEGPRRPPRR